MGIIKANTSRGMNGTRILLDGFLRLHAASSTSFKPETSLQAKRSCPYTVIIKPAALQPLSPETKSASPMVYAKRLDNPASRTFERCSSDKLEINGPCTRTSVI
ncbi:ATS3 embryo-specific protein 3 [Prunus dulcis]|uniref:ATS3 embryo-specific protein 3 n=1 Tax=Prunus dulcis TaxID=3755 RepID=A0A4Y1RVV7_PRUDU|nr:ATS3 embryo-specific protein 3 [Prunus dulcis]